MNSTTRKTAATREAQPLLAGISLIAATMVWGLNPVVAQAAAGVSLHWRRPPDVPIDRMDRAPRARKMELEQAEAVALAKGAAKKELGKGFDNYELKSVVFDDSAREWSVAFDLKQPKREAPSCLYVSVLDATKTTTIRRCSH